MKSNLTSQLLILGPIMVLIYYLHTYEDAVLSNLSILINELAPVNPTVSAIMTIWFISIIIVVAVIIRIITLIIEGYIHIPNGVPLLLLGLTTGFAQTLALLHFFGMGVLEGGLFMIQQQVYIPYFLMSISNILFLWVKNSVRDDNYV